MKFPKVSLIVPAYNEEKEIKNLLSSIMKLNYPKNKLETIVIDDKSTDRTAEVVKEFPVKLLKGGHKGVGRARNLGIKKSKGEIVLFIDADQILDKNYVKEIVKSFKDKRVGAASDTELLLNKDSLIAKLLFLRGKLAENQSNLLLFRACRKKIIEEVGYINPKYGMYDDWDLAKRVSKKYKIVKVNKAKIWHKYPANISEVYRQARWGGRSTIFLFPDYKIRAIKFFLFATLCAGLPVYIMFLFLSSSFRVLGTIGLILFLIFELLRSVKMFKITGWKEAFLTHFSIVFIIFCFLPEYLKV